MCNSDYAYLRLYIYIYIYIERERAQREEEGRKRMREKCMYTEQNESGSYLNSKKNQKKNSFNVSTYSVLFNKG